MAINRSESEQPQPRRRGWRGMVLRSVDAGKTWQALPTHTTRHLRGAAFNPRNGDLVVVGERIVRLAREAPQ